jgi:hypothetical protein
MLPHEYLQQRVVYMCQQDLSHALDCFGALAFAVSSELWLLR